MTNKVYVGNLLYETKEDDLVNHFSQIGNVTLATVVRFRNGLSKGFGFVEFENEDVARQAIEKFHNSDFMGRSIIVAEAQPPRPPEDRQNFRQNSGNQRNNSRSSYQNQNQGYSSNNSWGGQNSGIVDNWGSDNSNKNY